MSFRSRKQLQEKKKAENGPHPPKRRLSRKYTCKGSICVAIVAALLQSFSDAEIKEEARIKSPCAMLQIHIGSDL